VVCGSGRVAIYARRGGLCRSHEPIAAQLAAIPSVAPSRD
jgi:hypothetical protein